MKIKLVVSVVAVGIACFALGYWQGRPTALVWSFLPEELKREVALNLTAGDYRVSDIRLQNIGGFAVLYPESAKDSRLILQGPSYRVIATEFYATIIQTDKRSTGVADFDGDGIYERLDVGLPNVELVDTNFDGTFDVKFTGDEGHYFFDGEWHPMSAQDGKSGIVVDGVWREVDW